MIYVNNWRKGLVYVIGDRKGENIRKEFEEILISELHAWNVDVKLLNEISSYFYPEPNNGDILKYILEDNCSVVVCLSGTEAKIKIYISISDSSMEADGTVEKKVLENLERIMGK